MGTRGAWSRDFLHALGNQNPSEDTIKLVSAWTRAENTQARYNPLATTFTTDDATKFNSAGVKNYSSRSSGIDASVKTLNGNHAGYSELRQGLLSNDPQRSLGSGGFDTWGSHTSAVLIIYNTIDSREEPLKSEESGSTSGGSYSDSQGNVPASEPLPDRSRPENERLGTQVTADDIRDIAKIFLGIVLIGVGGILFVMAVMKTDAAQSAINTAVEVAL